jgi:hypothetical protein
MLFSAAVQATTAAAPEIGDACVISPDIYYEEPNTHCGGQFACINNGCAPLFELGERCREPCVDNLVSELLLLCMQEIGLRSAFVRRLLANSFRRFVVLGLCGAFPFDDCAGREILCIGGLCSENDENAKSVCRKYTTFGNKCESASTCQNVTRGGRDGGGGVCRRPPKEGKDVSCNAKLECCRMWLPPSIRDAKNGFYMYISPEKPMAETSAVKAPSAGNEKAEEKPEGFTDADVPKRGGLNHEVIGSLVGGLFALLAAILSAILTLRRWNKRGAATSESMHDSGHG